MYIEKNKFEKICKLYPKSRKVLKYKSFLRRKSFRMHKEVYEGK
jgi:hypothetical protein